MTGQAPILTVNAPSAETKSSRLISLDALRGFDMFWIISGEEIFHGFAAAIKAKYSLVQDPVSWQIAGDDRLTIAEHTQLAISNQLHHSPWNGFTFYDLIFPLFIFIAGVSMPFSYARFLSETGTDTKDSRSLLYATLLKRTVLLLLLGMVVNGLLRFEGYENTRFASVLGRIALACFFAAIIYLNCSLKQCVLCFAAILLGYWACLIFIPVPGWGAGHLTSEGNLAAYLDRLFLPGKLHRKVYDPEGLLSTIPSVATALLGIFTGQFLRWNGNNHIKPAQKMLLLFVAGIIFLLLGLLWNTVFPINKTIWSSSFVLFAGGCSLMLFAIFYGIIDVCGFKTWCQPFVWIGSNSILIYLAAHGLVNFEASSEFLFGGMVNQLPEQYHHPLIWTGVLIIQVLLLRFLYKRKLFLKL